MQDLYIQRNKSNSVWVFPGHGSQKQGMGLDLLAHPFARDRFQQAQEILGWSVPEVCQSQDQLSRTLYIQPCLYVVETLLADLMKREGYFPSVVAGYSLGEYAAVYAAGAFDFATGLRLIERRAELMNRAPKGKMVALVGFKQEQLEGAIDRTPDVWRANDDSRVAIVSGTCEAIEIFLTQVTAKRIIPLNADGAFHTPLMKPVASEFEQVLESTPFNPLQVPVLSSTKPELIVETAQLKKSLIRQMSEPVNWRATSLLIAQQGMEEVIEITPQKELVGQMKRICPELSFEVVSNLEAIAGKNTAKVLTAA
ncbi:acyltransferase domain-containing protein [Pleurocapsales cyanobacterium LEGE 10410]|nr:acyltransferase domain-containing protein [Pleurocapsales cyanobacterium LEGE 10410]